MRKKLFLIFGVIIGLCLLVLTVERKPLKQTAPVISTPKPVSAMPMALSLKSILHKEAITLNDVVLDKALTLLTCASQYHLDHTPILTIIDYSLPSSQKRLWVFDMAQNKLLFHTYVAHGINSGARFSTYFSNKYNSKASSIGVYKTDKSYAGREGMSLKLSGLDPRFNDNAENRAVVMHGGWYVEEGFIKRYGRAGRSWGCPALPLTLSDSIIQTIKNQGLLVIYYPNEQWLASSKYLNCQKMMSMKTETQAVTSMPVVKRKAVLLAHEMVVAMNTRDYEAWFHRRVPLMRMLRRQINHEEYVALSHEEMKQLMALAKDDPMRYRQALNTIEFIKPEIKMRRGYYITEMHKVMLGQITAIQAHTDEQSAMSIGSYRFYFQPQRFIDFKLNHQFIRWVGL